MSQDISSKGCSLIARITLRKVAYAVDLAIPIVLIVSSRRPPRNSINVEASLDSISIGDETGEAAEAFVESTSKDSLNRPHSQSKQWGLSPNSEMKLSSSIASLLI